MVSPLDVAINRWVFIALSACGWGLLGGPTSASAVETTTPIPMSKTLLVLKLDAEDPLAIHTTFQEHPPTLTIEFPAQRVVGSLPEHAVVAKGVIQTIEARYSKGPGPLSQRFIQSVQIELSASYAYRVRSEAGRIVVEIDHPASVGSAAVEVGLKGGTIIEGIEQRSVSERFRAMQEALSHMTPTPWSLQFTEGPERPPEAVASIPQAKPSRSEHVGPDRSVQGEQKAASTDATAAGTPRPIRSRSGDASMVGSVLALGVLVTMLAGLGFFLHGKTFSALFHRTIPLRESARLPSGVVLIDQLVWRTFERQGYHLMLEKELTQPIGGTLRVAMKDSVKSALLFVWNGPFFEKLTVEQFLHAMREAQVEQGVLVASGSFTVPAQRLAQEYHITLIEREELIGLLSSGATNEYVTKQLEQQQERLEEAQATLQQYANELDALRRQRNEASWYLGEERAKSAQLESQADELNQKVRHDEVELKRWEQETSSLRKQWEESQWYLGESRARARHLETQLTALQDLAQHAQTAEREGEKAQAALGEERARREALETKLAELEQGLETLKARERALQDALQRLAQEIGALRTYGERRRAVRARIPGVHVELHHGNGNPIFSGSPRDMSPTGFGLETDQAIPSQPGIRVRLTLPGCAKIESAARMRWQRAAEESSRYHSGYRLVGVPPSITTRIEQLLVEQS